MGRLIAVRFWLRRFVLLPLCRRRICPSHPLNNYRFLNSRTQQHWDVHKTSFHLHGGNNINEMVDKKAIDEGECMQLMRLCAEVRLQCRTCTAILQASPPSNFMPWTSGTHMTLNSLQKLHLLLNSEFTNTLKFLYEIAGNYDFQEIRANGLRSFLIITTRCLASILTFLRGMTAASSWSRSNGNILIAYINCFGELHTCLNLLKLMPRFCAPGSSFPRSELVGLPEVGSASGCTPVDSAPGQVDTDHTKSDDFMSDELVEFRNLQTRSDHIKQEYFYGHCVAFYFCPTAQRILLVLTSLMAGYGNSFLSSKQGLSNLVNTVFRSVTSYLSPEDRGAMVAKVSRDLNVGFCKNFWSFAENRLIAEGPNVILPSMAIAHVFELAPRPLRLPVGTDLSASGSEPTGDVSHTENAATVIVPYPVAHLGPTPLGVRLLSYRVRPGMEWAQPNLLSSIFQSARKPSSANDTNFSPDESGISSQKSSDSSFELGWKLSSPGLMSYSSSSAAPSSTAPQTVRESSLNDQSPYLLFHIHGGGFVALNSQAQDIFLRTWAEFLDCPIFSVNYSLAPQAPYPRALEECFFAYCWVTQNREKLGCKPDARIVLCGDSAGGNLVLGLCMRIIHSQVLPRPSGALVAYAPIVISFCPTPARMLSLADPLLPIGILSKCIMAYAGVDENQLNPENSKNDENSQLSPGDHRRYSVLSGTLWDRFVPTFWKNQEIQQPATLSTDKKKNPGAGREAVSLQSGTSESDQTYSAKRDVASCKSMGAFDFTDVNLGGATPFPDSSGPITASSSPGSPQSHCHFDLSDSEMEDKVTTPHLTPFPKRGTRSVFSRTIRAPKSDLDRVRDIRLNQDCFMSPYLAPDEMFCQLPPLGIACSTFDPFLDDCLHLAKRACHLNVPIDLRVFEDLPHAFLNFAPLGPEFQNANQVCMQMVKRLFERNSTTPGSRPDPSTTNTNFTLGDEDL